MTRPSGAAKNLQGVAKRKDAAEGGGRVFLEPRDRGGSSGARSQGWSLRFVIDNILDTAMNFK